MCIRDNSGIWRAVKERKGADEGPYVDGSGAEHEMLQLVATSCIVSGASEAEVNGVYEVYEAVTGPQNTASLCCACFFTL